MWLTIDTGGSDPATIAGPDRNYTYNLAEMWAEAGLRLPDCDGKLARDALKLLSPALALLEGNPEHFQPLEPANGWGTYEGGISFLRSLYCDWTHHPWTTVHVS